MSDLRKINNELKSFINEANFISNKCRNKLLKMLGETFSVDLPLENFANIDASITEEGNIIMRGDEYKSTSPVSKEEDLIEKYNLFKDKAEVLLKKKEKNAYTKNDFSNIMNLIAIAIIVIIYLVITGVLVVQAFQGNLFIIWWAAASVGAIYFPSYRTLRNRRILANRLEQANNFLKRKFKNKKKK